MTREEATKNLMPIKDLVIEKGWHSDFIESLDMAIKALEQEPILDKMRAEIVAKRDNLDEYDEEEGLMYTAYEEILGIIDKYKAESEDT